MSGNKPLFTSIVMLVLSGCSHQEPTADLKAYIAQLEAQKPAKVSPLPMVNRYQPAPFIAKNLRSPFSLMSIESSMTRTHEKEPLEYFPIDSMQYVGTISGDDQLWGLVKAPDDQVYKVQVNSYIGLNNARVIAVKENELVIVESILKEGHVESRQLVLELKQEPSP